MRFFKPNIQRMEEQKDIPGLMKALSDQDRDVALSALDALIRLGLAPDLLTAAQLQKSWGFWLAVAGRLQGPYAPHSYRFIDPVMSALKSENAEVKDIAVRMLGMIDDVTDNPAIQAKMLQFFSDILADQYFEIRQKAAEALVKIGARQKDPVLREHAQMVLVFVLKDQGYQLPVRKAAAEALKKLGWQPDRSEAGAAYYIFANQWDRCVEIGAPAVTQLMAALNDKSTHDNAAEALMKIGSAAVEPLVAALKGAAREQAAKVLAKIGSAAVEPLIAVFRGEDAYACMAAAEALAQIGDNQAIVPLIAALQSQNRYLRKTAADALGKLGWQPDKGEAGTYYWLVRGDWNKCLEIGREAVEALIAVLRDGKWDLNTRRGAVSALNKIGDARAVEPLIAVLTNDQDRDIRKTAAETLGKLGGVRAVGALMALLGSVDGDMRKAAAKALVELYEKGNLDDQSKQLILSHRQTMAQPHDDRLVSTGRSSDCTSEHTDTGIGVAL